MGGVFSAKKWETAYLPASKTKSRIIHSFLWAGAASVIAMGIQTLGSYMLQLDQDPKPTQVMVSDYPKSKPVRIKLPSVNYNPYSWDDTAQKIIDRHNEIAIGERLVAEWKKDPNHVFGTWEADKIQVWRKNQASAFPIKWTWGSVAGLGAIAWAGCSMAIGFGRYRKHSNHRIDQDLVRLGDLLLRDAQVR